MSYRLGVDLGTAYTAAATSRDGALEIVTLGDRTAVMPSLVLLRADGSVLVGSEAERRGNAEPERLAREFKRRIGDPTPLLLAGTPFAPEALQAEVLKRVVAVVTERAGERPERTALTHPANWGPFKLELLAETARLAGVAAPVLLSEPEAAARHYATQERIDPGEIIAVYDLGGGTFDAAVLRRTDAGYEILGTPSGIEHLGGVDFDEAVLGYVRSALGDELDQLDPDDPGTMAIAAGLRRECVDAKEALSSDTDVTVTVTLPSGVRQVRITRTEIESVIGPAIGRTVEALGRALESAAVTPGQLRAVLLVGGSSRIPLVGQRVSAALGRPVAVDAHPKHAVALGAAIAAAAAPALGGPMVLNIPLAAPPVDPPPVAPPPAPPREQWGPAQPVPIAVQTDDRKQRTVLLAVIVLALLAAGIAAVFLTRSDKPAQTASSDSESTTTTSKRTTTRPPTTTTPPTTTPGPVDITDAGTVSANSSFPDGTAPARLAVDHDTTTSWFSAGPGVGPGLFVWEADGSHRISGITIISNGENETPAFRTGFGFGAVDVTVFNGTEVVFQRSADLTGSPDPTIALTPPDVVGTKIELRFTGHESPDCGGFSELVVTGV